MEYKNYYKILGVSKTATDQEIKKKYRQLARKYHPDVSQEKNAEEKFKEIQEAYTVLKDPEKRKTYDQVGQYSAGGGPFGGYSAEQMRGAADGFHFQQGGNFEGFSDFFEQLFGGMRGRGARSAAFKTPGQDQHAKVEVTLEDAYNGAIQLLTLREPSVNAQGQVHYRTKQLKVKIPKGVVEGQQIRLGGQGTAGQHGGPNGDLYLEIHIKPHSLYTVSGSDVFLNLPITPWEAALGALIAVPTLGGRVNLKIPPGAQGGQKLRLKGRGLPSKSPGDEYVVLKVDVPVPNTDEQKKLYERMAELMPLNPRRQME